MAAVSSLILGGLILGKTVLDARAQHKAAKGAEKTGAVEGALYDQQARDATARGEEQVGHVASQAKVLTGAQRASLAAQGLDINSGSSSDVISTDQRLAQIAEGQIRLNAAREAFGFTEQGKLARMGAANTAAGYQNAMYSTLIGGATDLYSIYRSYGLNRTPRATVKPPASSGGFTGESRPDTGGF
jgi:hypothetical protein